MHEIEREAAIFYALVFCVAFVASFFRTIRDNEWRDYAHLLAIGCTSGAFAFGLISLLHDHTDNDGRSPWGYLGISALVGLLAKEQDNLARSMIYKCLFGLKVLFGEVNAKLNSNTEREDRHVQQPMQTRSEVGPVHRAGSRLPAEFPDSEQGRGGSGSK